MTAPEPVHSSPSESDSYHSWIEATLQPQQSVATPAALQVSRSQLEERWETHLDDRIKAYSSQNIEESATIKPLGSDAATNYRRHVKNFLDHLTLAGGDTENPLHTAITKNFVGITEAYLLAIRERNENYERTVRSAILGQFLPWAIETGLIKADLKQFEHLHPLPYRQLTTPIIEAWLLEQFPDSAHAKSDAATQYRMELRSFVLHVATTRLGVGHQAIKADARDFLALETAGEQRVAAVARNWAANPEMDKIPPAPPYKSAIEYILWDASTIESYILKLGERKSTRDTIKYPLSKIRQFYDWADRQGISIVSPEVVKNPFSNGDTSRVVRKKSSNKMQPGKKQPAPKTPAPDTSFTKKTSTQTPAAKKTTPPYTDSTRPAVKQKRTAAKPEQAVATKPKTVDTQTTPKKDSSPAKKIAQTIPALKTAPETRRARFDAGLQKHTTERDQLITALVSSRACSFEDVCALRLQDVQVQTHKAMLAVSGKDPVIITDTEILNQLVRYMVIRSSPEDLTYLKKPRSPFFISADGGSLTVEPDLKDKQSKELLQIRHSENFLLTHLMQEESMQFADLRVTSLEAILEHTFISPDTFNKVKAYKQVMRVLPLSSACTPPPMGPGIAFPGADGWYLTADE